jgi:S-adenosylmethionine-diacylglycerol 3-amino-3-carboxypropyl transferase
MPESSSLLYAVIREDARLEGDLVHRVRAKNVLCVASGGCVALSIAARFRDVNVTAFDTNALQLEHMMKKADAARRRDVRALNVEDAASLGLNQAGEFEKVFRLLRAFFEEFIAPHRELLAFFTRSRPLQELDEMVRRWTGSRYWAAAFHACFSEALVRSTLGERPARWAMDGSHTSYFQQAFRRGLRRDAAPENPFLQHVFLGGYRRGCEPTYIRLGGPREIEPIHGTLTDVPRLDRFDVVSLSNLLDGCSDADASRWAEELRTLAPGSALLLRQLNSTRDLRPLFEPHFRFDTALGRSYFYRDRSLLYNRIEVGFRV